MAKLPIGTGSRSANINHEYLGGMLTLATSKEAQSLTRALNGFVAKRLKKLRLQWGILHDFMKEDFRRARAETAGGAFLTTSWAFPAEDFGFYEMGHPNSRVGEILEAAQRHPSDIYELANEITIAEFAPHFVDWLFSKIDREKASLDLLGLSVWPTAPPEPPEAKYKRSPDSVPYVDSDEWYAEYPRWIANQALAMRKHVVYCLVRSLFKAEGSDFILLDKSFGVIDPKAGKEESKSKRNTNRPKNNSHRSKAYWKEALELAYNVHKHLGAGPNGKPKYTEILKMINPQLRRRFPLEKDLARTSLTDKFKPFLKRRDKEKTKFGR